PRRGVAAVPHGRAQRRILDEDRALELLELDTRLQTELVVEEGPGPPVDVEALRLPPRPIEGEHQLCAKALAVGVLDDQRLELGNERRLPTEAELGLDPLLESGDTELLDPLDLEAGKRLELEVGQRSAAPESLCAPEQLDCRLRVACAQRVAAR